VAEWVWLPDELDDDPVARRLGVGAVAMYVAVVAEAVRAMPDDADELFVPASWTADFAGRPADRHLQRLIDCGWLRPVDSDGAIEWLRVAGPVGAVLGHEQPAVPLRLLTGSG
jgi:hypothetical protein